MAVVIRMTYSFLEIVWAFLDWVGSISHIGSSLIKKNGEVKQVINAVQVNARNNFPNTLHDISAFIGVQFNLSRTGGTKQNKALLRSLLPAACYHWTHWGPEKILLSHMTASHTVMYKYFHESEFFHQQIKPNDIFIYLNFYRMLCLKLNAWRKSYFFPDIKGDFYPWIPLQDYIISLWSSLCSICLGQTLVFSESRVSWDR